MIKPEEFRLLLNALRQVRFKVFLTRRSRLLDFPDETGIRYMPLGSGRSVAFQQDDIVRFIERMLRETLRSKELGIEYEDVPRQLAARSWQSDPVPRLAVLISGREAPGAPGWTPAQPLPNGGRRIRRRRSYAIWPDLAASRPLIVARAQSCAEWFRRESVFNLSQVGRSGTRFFPSVPFFSKQQLTHFGSARSAGARTPANSCSGA